MAAKTKKSSSKSSGSKSSSGRKTTAGAAKRRSTKPRAAASKRTVKKPSPATSSRRPAAAKNREQDLLDVSLFGGLLLLAFALILVLALSGCNGILLGGMLKLVGGLLGHGTRMFCIALSVAGVFLLYKLQPLRLRVLCLLTFPVLWSTLLHCILSRQMSLSFSTVWALWEQGASLSSGGVIGGLLAAVLTLLLSAPGAKIILVFVIIVWGFIIFNTTPARLYRRLAQMITEDTEELRGQDMTVTPARRGKASASAQPTKKRGNLFTFLRDRRAKRKARRLQTQQQAAIAAEARQPVAAASGVRAPQKSDAAHMSARQRLAQVMPEDHAVVEENAPPWEDDVPPWHTNDDVPPESKPDVQVVEVELDTQPKPKSRKKRAPAPKADLPADKQIEQEISDAASLPVPQYLHPSIELLKSAPRTSNTGMRSELMESSERLVDTLSSFGIDVQIINIVRGPSVTRFELQMERGIKVSRITALSDDIALALGAYSVRIAPIPDKLAIGIEVPNKHVQMVALRDVLSSKGFEQTPARLAVALGKDITGSAQIIDLAKMPHLLIAGTTGSGKSVCINSILISLLYKSAPEDVRLIMIDPKMVELANYNGIPHLLVPVVTDPKKASGALNWAVGEMERRYSLFAASGVRDLADYNRQARLQAERAAQQPDIEIEGEKVPAVRKLEPLPQIVIVIDELADLMMVAAKEVETSICRIAQKARAAGMHLVVATQRPSADVITGIMKSNIPSRIAFAVASQVESRIILDTPGAEKLIGRGDMLYAPIGMNKPKRIQGCFVSSEEIERVIAHVKTTSVVEYSQEIMEHIEKQAEAGALGDMNGAEDEDELMPQAITIVVESGQASVSMLQRRLKLGYARAARLVDQMEERGIVGPFEGSKPRQVLITKDDWMQIQLRQKI